MVQAGEQVMVFVFGQDGGKYLKVELRDRPLTDIHEDKEEGQLLLTVDISFIKKKKQILMI